VLGVLTLDEINGYIQRSKPANDAGRIGKPIQLTPSQTKNTGLHLSTGGSEDASRLTRLYGSPLPKMIPVPNLRTPASESDADSCGAEKHQMDSAETEKHHSNAILSILGLGPSILAAGDAMNSQDAARTIAETDPTTSDLLAMETAAEAVNKRLTKLADTLLSVPTPDNAKTLDDEVNVVNGPVEAENPPLEFDEQVGSTTCAVQLPQFTHFDEGEATMAEIQSIMHKADFEPSGRDAEQFELSDEEVQTSNQPESNPLEIGNAEIARADRFALSNQPIRTKNSRSRPRRSSDCSSISETSSLPSIADSVFSLASGSSMSSIVSTHGAGDRLATLLLENPILRPMYQEALAKVTLERLERNLRRMLKLFAFDLRKEAENPKQKNAARFVRSRARNSAHIICRSLNSEMPQPTASSLPVINITQEIVEDASDNSSESDTQKVEPQDLRELEAFIVTSSAFEALTLNLRLFIYPEELKSLVVNESKFGAVVEQPTVEHLADDLVEIDAMDVTEDTRKLHLQDTTEESSCLKSSIMSKCWRATIEKCRRVSEGGYLRKIIALLVSILISLSILLRMFINIMPPWDLVWDPITESPLLFESDGSKTLSRNISKEISPNRWDFTLYE
jgi:hypothetical protein